MSLITLLRAGGIYPDIAGESRLDVLRDLVDRLPLDREEDRRALVASLEARERLCSTAVGGGIAVPHARSTGASAPPDPLVALGLLREPIEFGAADGKKVHALFLVIAPNASVHLAAMSQLGRMLRDATLRGMLVTATPTSIFARVDQLTRAFDRETTCQA